MAPYGSPFSKLCHKSISLVSKIIFFPSFGSISNSQLTMAQEHQEQSSFNNFPSSVGLGARAKSSEETNMENFFKNKFQKIQNVVPQSPSLYPQNANFLSPLLTSSQPNVSSSSFISKRYQQQEQKFTIEEIVSILLAVKEYGIGKVSSGNVINNNMVLNGFNGLISIIIFRLLFLVVDNRSFDNRSQVSNKRKLDQSNDEYEPGSEPINSGFSKESVIRDCATRKHDHLLMLVKSCMNECIFCGNSRCNGGLVSCDTFLNYVRDAGLQNRCMYCLLDKTKNECKNNYCGIGFNRLELCDKIFCANCFCSTPSAYHTKRSCATATGNIFHYRIRTAVVFGIYLFVKNSEVKLSATQVDIALKESLESLKPPYMHSHSNCNCLSQVYDISNTGQMLNKAAELILKLASTKKA